MDLDNRRLALKLARECGIAEPSTQKLEKFITLAFEACNRRAENAELRRLIKEVAIPNT